VTQKVNTYSWAFFLRLISFKRRRDMRTIYSTLKVLGIPVWASREEIP
jgi:hypothetical protein